MEFLNIKVYVLISKFLHLKHAAQHMMMQIMAQKTARAANPTAKKKAVFDISNCLKPSFLNLF